MRRHLSCSAWRRDAKARVALGALLVATIVYGNSLPGFSRSLRTPIYTDVDTDDGLTNRLLDAVSNEIDHSRHFVMTSRREQHALFLGIYPAISRRQGHRRLVSATIAVSRGFSAHAPTRTAKVTCWDGELANCAASALKLAATMVRH